MSSCRQLLNSACSHGGVTKVKDDDEVMFTKASSQVVANKANLGQSGDAVCPSLSKPGLAFWLEKKN